MDSLLMGLFILALCGGWAFELRTVEQFKANWGANLYDCAGERRRKAGGAWLFGYLIFVGIGYPADATLSKPLWFIAMIIWGGHAAWSVGEAAALKRLTRDLLEAHARKQLDEGLFDAPVAAAVDASPFAGQVVSRPDVNTTPQHDFSFDPDRFKR